MQRIGRNSNPLLMTFKKLSGNSKIKVSSTGKVTVKKGLKKGTYKLRVYASADTYKGTYNSFVVKIRVK